MYVNILTHKFAQNIKGTSKNINIFMSVQTVHFFRPPPPSPPSVQTNIFSFQNIGFMHNIYYATNLTLPSNLFDM